MISRPSFKDFYLPNINWLDDCEIDTHKMLRSFYPEYHTSDLPNLVKLKEGIIANDIKAKEFFKCLYKSSHVQRGNTISIANNCFLETISKQSGHQIYAHGVEEAKGGMNNLLMMSIANCVRVPSSYWGHFKEGMPNMSPLCHGPYYIIYTIHARQMKTQPHYPTLRQISYILVPFSENITILKEKSAALWKDNMIDEMQHQLFCSKLIDYEGLSLKLSCKNNVSLSSTEPDKSPKKKPLVERNNVMESSLKKPKHGTVKPRKLFFYDENENTMFAMPEASPKRNQPLSPVQLFKESEEIKEEKVLLRK